MILKEKKYSLLSGREYIRLLKITDPLMYGADIKSVQNKLNSLGYNVGIADGYYGNITSNAVREFQKDNGLDIDGIVGLKTWNKLFYTMEGNINANIKKIFIDPGHGGSDPGASGNGIIERDKVLDIAFRLGELLKAKGIQVKYSRNENSTYVELSERAKMANEWKADIFISIHANSFSASSAYGTETFSYTNGSSISENLALRITNSIASSMKLYNRGAKKANFVVIRESNMPAVLVETAFLTNESDANVLKTNPQGFAIAIAKGILGEDISENGYDNNGNYHRVLKLENPMMKGEDIKNIQMKLNKEINSELTVDGIFGQGTDSAVRNFQIKNNLIVDGIIGKITWDKLMN